MNGLNFVPVCMPVPVSESSLRSGMGASKGTHPITHKSIFLLGHGV
jgi:hypothetical protein